MFTILRIGVSCPQVEGAMGDFESLAKGANGRHAGYMNQGLRSTNMKHFSTCVLFGLLALLGSPALTQPVATLPPVSAIIFSPGSPTSTVNGQLTPAGRDLYYVLAKAGQTLLVSITSDANVTFQVYTADTTLAKSADGKPLIEGKTLPGAGAGDDAKAWVGAIPRDGNHLIAAGIAGGGGAAVPTPYGLTVSLQ